MSLISAEEMLQVAYARPFPAPNKEVYIRTVVSYVCPDSSELVGGWCSGNALVLTNEGTLHRAWLTLDV